MVGNHNPLPERHLDMATEHCFIVSQGHRHEVRARSIRPHDQGVAECSEKAKFQWTIVLWKAQGPFGQSATGV